MKKNFKLVTKNAAMYEIFPNPRHGTARHETKRNLTKKTYF